ncbi:SDR family NAD(P)-dependent oxidoreductase [Streptomyces griseomycini]|uniref:NAD(P)-dependent dehydrogenase (Short-subunit alcohol dehydrogenase family) n=1 Tax=Streptomyces griseomycini TaxID=66895 RepID=A0A7W7LUJ6_9ACTN|nr:SDR family oxidoreductase [Streptomyces griseomycini]MBB4895996.1 NAD(P)-dependent dehydrogenase (short-subunit alcohol dehydrogenase family) [Streptomyces griseomycini]GGR40506.1 oxidoreductase [Streptomyces griseomycini]
MAVITGASKGLGEALAARGWDLVLDARDPVPLAEAAGAVSAHGTRVAALPGDVTDAGHRAELVAAAKWPGGVDLLVHNASTLGAEALVRLEERPLDGLRGALEVDLVAALGLVQETLPLLRASRAGTVIAVSPDAGAEASAAWGGYGASKAALDQLAAVPAVEEPGLRVWAVDPGDMATDLYAAAVPDDDGPRPEPARVVPAFLRMLDERPASGRYAAPALLRGGR